MVAVLDALALTVVSDDELASLAKLEPLSVRSGSAADFKLPSSSFSFVKVSLVSLDELILSSRGVMRCERLLEIILLIRAEVSSPEASPEKLIVDIVILY